MIDYEKLKKAHELANQSNGYLETKFSTFRGMDDPPLFQAYLAFGADGLNFDDINILLAKLEEYVKPKPKYKVGSRVFIENGKEIYSFKVDKIFYDNGYWYLNRLNDGDFEQYREDILFSSKEALIEAQIEYWRSLLPDSQKECEHESDGEDYRLQCMHYYKCKKCGEFYR